MARTSNHGKSTEEKTVAIKYNVPSSNYSPLNKAKEFARFKEEATFPRHSSERPYSHMIHEDDVEIVKPLLRQLEDLRTGKRYSVIVGDWMVTYVRGFFAIMSLNDSEAPMFVNHIWVVMVTLQALIQSLEWCEDA